MHFDHKWNIPGPRRIFSRIALVEFGNSLRIGGIGDLSNCEEDFPIRIYLDCCLRNFRTELLCQICRQIELNARKLNAFARENENNSREQFKTFRIPVPSYPENNSAIPVLPHWRLGPCLACAVLGAWSTAHVAELLPRKGREERLHECELQDSKTRA